MLDKRVLIVGGTGHFGQLLAEDLRRYSDCELVIADRHRANLWNPASLDVALSGVSIAICVAGPFQTLPTTLAELCLRRGVHYIDFADDRNFVRKIQSLVPPQNKNLPAICPSWSTVSALSAVLAEIGAAGSDNIDGIYIHMAPGNRNRRGTGTIASLLHSVGQPFTLFRDGRWCTVRGWSEPRDFGFPQPIGCRRGYLVDVPDHGLFPDLFHARAVEFRTSSEVRALNFALSSLGWLVRNGIVRSWAPWSRTLERAAALGAFVGHDWGGVGVEVITSRRHRRVSVIAHSGSQRIAVMPASVMTVSLLSGSKQRGLISPAHWLSLEQLREECEKRGFQLVAEDL